MTTLQRWAAEMKQSQFALGFLFSFTSPSKSNCAGQDHWNSMIILQYNFEGISNCVYTQRALCGSILWNNECPGWVSRYLQNLNPTIFIPVIILWKIICWSYYRLLQHHRLVSQYWFSGDQNGRYVNVPCSLISEPLSVILNYFSPFSYFFLCLWSSKEKKNTAIFSSSCKMKGSFSRFWENSSQNHA